MDYSKITDIAFDGITGKDYPDFSDAHIISAYYDGVEMTEEQLDEINSDGDFVHEKLMDQLY